ncbi:MAG TPA: CRTAC1 family protein, partial [Verrucomicrobiae bacterium]|nr:CRTAC1 family protein [Verrucomicrobiae bacterium]
MARAGALQWQQGNGYRFADVQVPADGKTGFALLPGQSTGISFTNHLSDFFAAKNRILENGSGVALGDVDGDGWCDIYFCRLEGPNVLYRNLGNWRFEDITQSAGVACDGQFSTGALLADVDGNGTLDLLVNSIGGGTRLFLNDGKAHFTEVMDSGLARQFGSTSMAMADIDGDGDLELYVANYRTTTFKDAPPGIVPPQTRRVDGKIVVTPEDRFAGVLTKGGAIRLREVGEPDILYVNKGQGHFGAISWLSGAFVDDEGNKLSGLPRDWGLSAMFRDINGDGTPDIYVCNDFFYSPDRVWLNEGGRRFRAAPRLALRDMSMSSMSVDFADINRDGFDDIFVADMLSRDHLARHRQRANTMLMREAPLPITDSEFRPEVIRNTLFLNRGDGTYAEIAQFAGLQASEWSWSAIFMDVDLDGYEDLLITNGNDRDVLDADTIKETAVAGKSAEQHLKDLQKFPRLETANLAFRNRGDLTFEEKGASWGFNTPGVSHGMALADLDNDGDLDVVVNNLNSGAGIYRNETPAARVAIRLKGVAPNTRGIGAKIKVSGGPVTQSQEMIAGGRYLSCDDSVRVFAGGSATNNLKIEVTWRSGRRSV